VGRRNGSNVAELEGYRPGMAPGDGERSCGECALCCTILRVDDLAKLGGTPCAYLRREGSGCSIHAHRPSICRGYRCYWLQGGLQVDDRPDRLGAVIDLVSAGGQPVMAIREASPGSYQRSARLAEIAAEFREHHAVRITDAGDVMDPDREYRVLLAGGEEHRVRGDRIEVWQDGARTETRRRPWIERAFRRIAVWRTSRKVHRLAR
jgi:Fe-S-cluster containining protein